MTPERHRQVMDLFDRVCDVARIEREALLAAACVGDPELRREVLSLLDHHDRATTIADRAAAGVEVALAELASEARQEPAGLPARIGSYRPLRVLGSGSMGVVYEAEQDRPLRRVAVKVLHGKDLPRELVRRFEREAEVLGRMQHPGIAQVFEAGMHEGVPFLAMELVDGVTFDATARTLPRRERLALVARVCDAVQHAHDHGVVHRDLKPGNVLVDAHDLPKVVDFGIARLLDRDGHTDTLQTLTGQLIGTLGYMSPEQLGGDPELVDARADVFALGVMLHEALVGTLPQDTSGLSFADAVLTLRNDEALPIEGRDPSLRGDLATIVHTAIAKDRARRYPSAAALATDLRHHLADEPIVARAPSTIYLLHKFARRHRVLVVASLAVLVALVAGLSVALAGWANARAERALAVAARDESDAVTAFLVSTISAASPLEGQNTTVRDLLDRMAPAIASQYAERPRIEARLGLAAGSAYLAMSEFARAATVLARAQTALDHLAEPDPDLALRIRAKLASVELEKGRYRAALAEFDALVALAERDFGAGAQLTLDLVEQRGSTRLLHGDAEGSLVDIDRVLAGRTSVGSADPFLLATTRANRAAVLNRLGRYAEARSILEESIAAMRAAGGELHPHLADALVWLAETNQLLGHVDESAGPARAALAIQKQIYDRPNPSIANSYHLLAKHAYLRGERREALTLYEAALAQREASLPASHPDVAGTLCKIGELHQMLGELEVAEKTLRRGLEVLPKDAPDRGVRGWLQDALARTLVHRGHFEEAERLQTEAVARIVDHCGEEHPDVLIVKANLGLVLYQAGKLEEAAKVGEEVLALRLRIQGEEHPDVALARFNTAMIVWQLGRNDRALELARGARAGATAKLGVAHPTTLAVRLLEGRLLRRLGRLDEAAKELAAVREAPVRPGQEELAVDARLELAMLAADRGDARRAQRLAQEGAALVKSGIESFGLSGFSYRTVKARAALLEGRHEDAERDLLAVEAALSANARVRGGSEHLDVRKALVELFEKRGDADMVARWRAPIAR